MNMDFGDLNAFVAVPHADEAGSERRALAPKVSGV
jgi:hypothetical protein